MENEIFQIFTFFKFENIYMLYVSVGVQIQYRNFVFLIEEQ